MDEVHIILWSLDEADEKLKATCAKFWLSVQLIMFKCRLDISRFNQPRRGGYSGKIKGKLHWTCRLSSLWLFPYTTIGREFEQRHVPYQLMYLNTQLPLGGAVWGGFGTLRRCSVTGGSALLGVGFESL